MDETKNKETPCPKKTQQKCHELQVRHAKLEMQNEELHRIQRALEASRAAYIDLYDLAPIGYFTASERGVILAANLTAATLLGVPREALLLQPTSHFVLPEDQDILYQCHQRLFETGSTQNCELRMLRAAANPLWARLEGTAARDRETGAPLCRVVMSDISERKSAEMALLESQQRYAITLSAISDGLWDWDVPSGKAFFTEQFYSLLGYENHEFPSSYAAWRERVHPEDIAQAEQMLQASIDAGVGFEIHVRMRVKSGQWQWVSVRGKVIEWDATGAALRMVGTLRDITTRKMVELNLLTTERALRQANEQLDVRVRESTAALRQTVDTLQIEIEHRQQTELKLSSANEALQTLTNQLRALAGELTMAEHCERKRLARILHDHLQQMLASAKLRVSCLEGMGQEVAQIVAILDDSLTMSRSLATELYPPILQEGSLQDVMEWLGHWMCDKHGMNIDLVMQPEVISLPEDVKIFLFDVVRELLFNARKHSNVSRACLSLQQIDATTLRVTISDQGVGFDVHSIFKSGGISGSGLGLFSVIERLRLFGGNLDIDSAPGKGSCFTLTVPVTTAPFRERRKPGKGSCFTLTVPLTLMSHQPDVLVAAGLESTTANQSGQKPVDPQAVGVGIRVLLADDHTLFRNGIDRLLQKEPDIVVVGYAKDGREAIDLARKLKPNVILMDISMPQSNGIQATRVIHQEYPDIRIIGLSIFQNQERAQIMLEAGAVDYKHKGCSAAELIAAVRACVRESGSPAATLLQRL